MDYNLHNGYKIGDVSKMFGLSNDAIRYYESCGIITPRRDEYSGYRYYDSWEMNYLLDCLWYRGFDFSTSDIEQMIHRDSLDDLLKHCKERERSILQSISEQQQKLKKLSQLVQRIGRIPQDLGQFSIENSPELIWQIQRTNDRDEYGELETGEAAESVRVLSKQMPFVEHTFKMPAQKTKSFDEYCWGFALSPNDFDRMGIKIPATAEYIPSYKSVYTVFSAGGEGSFMDCIQEQVIAPVKEMGYRITNPPYGNLLTRVHEEGEMKRYFEVWVPIE